VSALDVPVPAQVHNLLSDIRPSHVPCPGVEECLR
jgi:ABC-type oligopeptide transport system ATPase subunit